MSENSPTRTAILDVAEAMLRERGFPAFSYQDIADRVGIRKASVHYHFPSKEGLGVALVERFSARLKALGQGVADAAPVEKFELYFKSTRAVLKEKDKICAFGILSAEINALPPEMRALVQQMMAKEVRWLERVLEEGRTAGHFQDTATVQEQAALVSASLQGALQVARATENPEHFHAVERFLKSQILTEAGRAALRDLPPCPPSVESLHTHFPKMATPS
jgi:TetR/AcrR family transcriptional repressor of nem operon